MIDHCELFFFILILLVLRNEMTTCGEGISKRKTYRHALISVLPNNSEDIKYLERLEKEKGVHLWSASQKIGDEILLLISRNKMKGVKEYLRRRKIKFNIEILNLQRSILQEKETISNLRISDAKSYSFNQYHSYESIVQFLKSFTEQNKDISRMETIGTSSENRTIYIVKISKNIEKLKIKPSQGSKNIILMDCGFHSREWTGISFCLSFINELIAGLSGKSENMAMKDVVEKYDFLIIPVINPDGYVYSHSFDRLWRKTRSQNRGASCVGTDANRNFLANTGVCDEKDPCSQEYCGEKPFSEPETASFRDLLKETAGRLKAYFSIHTNSEMWLLPFGETKKEPKNYIELMRVANIGAKALAHRYGRTFQVGSAAKLLYIASGTSMDYVYNKGYAKYVYTLELRDKKDAFMLPLDQLLSACQETSDGVVAAILAMT